MFRLRNFISTSRVYIFVRILMVHSICLTIYGASANQFANNENSINSQEFFEETDLPETKNTGNSNKADVPDDQDIKFAELIKTLGAVKRVNSVDTELDTLLEYVIGVSEGYLY